VSNSLLPILYLFQLPTSTLSRKLQIVLSAIETPFVIETQRRPGPKDIPSGIPKDQWSTVMHRVLEKKESLRTVAHEYGVSHETIRRIILQVQKQRIQQ
jgi:response regulator of citrate/malate metabolism